MFILVFIRSKGKINIFKIKFKQCKFINFNNIYKGKNLFQRLPKNYTVVHFNCLILDIYTVAAKYSSGSVQYTVVHFNCLILDIYTVVAKYSSGSVKYTVVFLLV